MADLILQADNPSGYEPIGKDWVTKLTKRRPELKCRFARRYNRQRAQCEDPKVIRTWFEILQRTRMQYGILDEDIFNFDETGFAMGVIATSKVVARSEMPGKPHLIQPGNQEWVTAIECINASGWAIPTTIIFKGKVHIKGWYQDGRLPGDWRIEVSKNGWTTDEIGLRWLLKVFIPATTSRTVGRYRLLVLDGHGSHLTPQFVNQSRIERPTQAAMMLCPCDINSGVSICLHSGDRLQPGLQNLPAETKCFSCDLGDYVVYSKPEQILANENPL